MINQPVAPAPTLDDILRLFSETDRKFQETDRLFKERSAEADRRSKEVNHKIKELGKQIDGLGEKFGSFTEGLALPSMERILQQRFNMEVISPSVRVSKAGEHVEAMCWRMPTAASIRLMWLRLKAIRRRKPLSSLPTC